MATMAASMDVVNQLTEITLNFGIFHISSVIVTTLTAMIHYVSFTGKQEGQMCDLVWLLRLKLNLIPTLFPQVIGYHEYSS